MNEHAREQRQKENQAERDGIIVGIYDGFEKAEPDISTERLLEQTCQAAKCSTDRLLDALQRTGKLEKME